MLRAREAKQCSAENLRVSHSSTLSLIPFTEAWAVNEYIILDIGMTFSPCLSCCAMTDNFFSNHCVLFIFLESRCWKEHQKFVMFHLPLANRIVLKPSKMGHLLSVVFFEPQAWRTVIRRMLETHPEHAV